MPCVPFTQDDDRSCAWMRRRRLAPRSGQPLERINRWEPSRSDRASQSSFIAKANIEMTDNRRQRADSAATAVQAAQNAALGPREPLPYAPVPDAVLPFWEAVMRNRPRDRWNDLDLCQCAVLAWRNTTWRGLMRRLHPRATLSTASWNPKHALAGISCPAQIMSPVPPCCPFPREPTRRPRPKNWGKFLETQTGNPRPTQSG